MKKQIIYVAIISTLLTSCIKEQENIIGGDTNYEYHARECNYLWTDNVQFIHGKDIVVGDVVIEDVYSIRKIENLKDGLNAANYALSITTCNKDTSDFPAEHHGSTFSYTELLKSEYYDPTYQCPYMVLSSFEDPQTDEADKELERLIESVLTDKSTTKANFEIANYRTSILSGINITCNKTLFGIESGKSLNQYFSINSVGEHKSYIISNNKRLVSTNVKEIQAMSLSQYVSYKPYVPELLYLTLKSAPSEVPVELTFTVEFEIDDEKTITHTTPPILLK